MISLSALRWIADQNASFVMLERDGRVLTTTGPVRASDTLPEMNVRKVYENQISADRLCIHVDPVAFTVSCDQNTVPGLESCTLAIC
jgi:hypothetical protein